MTTNDGFLSRWSRRKAAQSAPKPAPPQADTLSEMPAAIPDAPALELPDIETLGSGSDYTAFLQKGVAAAVQRRALQRAWESDAVIAGFRGMADYDWDFNAPTYGRLWATDNVPELLRAVLASPPAREVDPEPDAEPDPSAPPPPEFGPSHELSALLATAPAAAPAAGMEDSAAEPLPRRHGSALPA